MSANKTKILLTGATGYVGGTVLERFLSRPDAHKFEFTVLVRDATKAEKFKTFGVKAVVGSHSDAPLMEALASEADAVIATADCDDLVAAKATLAGLKKKFEATGVKPIFINTSGTGVLAEDAKGMFSSDLVYDDSDAAQIATLPETRIHRNVDLAITDADAEGYVKSYIVLPGIIWGLAKTRFVDAGIQHRQSMAIPMLVKFSLDRGSSGMVGAGKNLWPNVEIDEQADFYSILWDAIVANPTLGHGRSGYFFGAGGEGSFLQVAEKIGEVLFALGKVKNAEPTTFTQADLDKYFKGSAFFGTNARCRPTHSLSLGWKPVKGTKEMLESIRLEVEATVGL